MGKQPITIKDLQEILDRLAWNPADSKEMLIAWIKDTQDYVNGLINSIEQPNKPKSKRRKS